MVQDLEKSIGSTLIGRIVFWNNLVNPDVSTYDFSSFFVTRKP